MGEPRQRVPSDPPERTRHDPPIGSLAPVAAPPLDKRGSMLAALIDATSDAVYVKDTQGRYLLFNRAAEAVTGKSATEVLGADDTAVFASAEAEVVMEGDRKAIAAPAPVTYEETVTDAAGVVRTYLSTKGPVRDQTGALLGLFGIARDITERKHAEEQLAGSEARLRRFFDAPFVGTLIVGSDGVLKEANDYFLSLVGRPRDELERGEIDMPAMTPSEWQPATNKGLAAARTGAAAVPYEKEYLRPDGTRVAVLVANTVLPSLGTGSGTDQLIASFVLDNRERTAADRALRESEERFRALVESANDAIFIWDKEGLRCLEANRTACERLGYTRAELLTMTAAQISAPDQAAVAAARAEAIAERGSAFVETVHMARDGTRIPVEVSTTVTQLGGRPVFLSIARDITERKRAEAEAAVANERLRQFFNAGVIGSLIARPDGTIIEANDYFLAMIGRTRDEFDHGSIDWRSITPADQQSLTDRAIADMQALGGGGSYEKEYLRPDGTRVQALVVAGALPGTTDQGAAFVLDITERKRTEARLAEQTALLRSIIESSEAAVFAVDREYRYTAFNAQHAATMRALYGVRVELGRSLLDYQRSAGDDVGAKRNLDRALAGERFTDEGFSGEEERTRAYFEVTHSPVRDPDGMIVGASVFARDTTARHLADDERRDTQALLDQTQEIARIGGWKWEAATNAVTWTDEVYRIHELARDEYDPNSAARDIEFYAPEGRARIGEAFRLAVSKGQPYDLELPFVTARGRELWIRTSGHPAIDNGRVIRIYGDIRDITERKWAEEEIRALNTELEARVAQRTAALEVANRELEAFSYSVSHDLRAPLRAIDSFGRILLAEHAAQLNAEGVRVLGVVVRNARQMGVLIDDLLAFSRVARQALEPREVDMGKLARSVADEVAAAEPGHGLVFDIDGLCAVPGDPALLRQVWVNLLGNAAKFSRPVERPCIDVRCEQDPRESRFTVRDNGVGFDPVYADKLFQPFQRLHSATEFEGTGIGLAIVARIVGRHGGRVWADGAPGAGATFGFALPTETEMP